MVWKVTSKCNKDDAIFLPMATCCCLPLLLPALLPLLLLVMSLLMSLLYDDVDAAIDDNIDATKDPILLLRTQPIEMLCD